MSASLTDLPFVDLYIRMDAPDKPLFRSSQRGESKWNQIVPDDFLPAVERFSTAIRAELQDRPEGTLESETLRCRLVRQRMADGSVWVCAHRINTELPTLDKLGFAPHITAHLRSLGMREGLVIVSGSAGHGKTTTAAGLLVDFLQTHGGTAITIEDPVEYVLKGRHGQFGQCFQIDLREEQDCEQALEQALRWSPRYIFVGEVRTPEAAQQLLHAATTGHTVITTLNGGMPEEALVGLLYLAEQAMGKGACDILAGSLTALLHQTLKEDGPFVRYLFTEESAPSDPIRSLIREGKIGMLSTYIDRIAARLANQPLGSFSSKSSSPPPMAAHAPLPPLGK